MSLATIMWGSKNGAGQNTEKNGGSSEAISRGASCQESSNRCFWLPATGTTTTTTSTARLSSVIRSRGDSFYLVDGAQRQFHHPPCWNQQTNHVQQEQQTDKIKKMTTRDCSDGGISPEKRRCSEPDLIRRRMNPFSLNNLRSVGDLTVRHHVRHYSQEKEQQAPIFVVVSLPAGTTTTCSVIDTGSMDEKTRRRRRRDGELLSSSASNVACPAANLSHILWPTTNKRNANHQLVESSRRQHSLLFDYSRTMNSSPDHNQGFRQHNSLSCPLISP